MPDDERITLEALIDDWCHEPIVPHEHARLTAALTMLRRKATAWEVRYGMVDAAVAMGHPLMATRGPMADLLRRQREEGEDDVS